MEKYAARSQGNAPAPSNVVLVRDLSLDRSSIGRSGGGEIQRGTESKDGADYRRVDRFCRRRSVGGVSSSVAGDLVASIDDDCNPIRGRYHRRILSQLAAAAVGSRVGPPAGRSTGTTSGQAEAAHQHSH